MCMHFHQRTTTMRQHVLLISLVFELSAGLFDQAASAAELASAPVYSVTEVVFTGPQQTGADAPARDVHP